MSPLNFLARSCRSATTYVVIEDAAAHTLLDEVIVEWTAGSVLPTLRDLVTMVWRTNLDRHEWRLGDDALTLGLQSSRNLCNLAVRQLATLDGVVARDARTLEVTYKGRVLHTGKITSTSPTWETSGVDWSESDVRYSGAAANTTAYIPVAGTLFEHSVPGQPADPTVMRYLHLSWQGMPDGATRAWLGFPRLGDPAWFAVVLLDEQGGDSGGLAPDDDAPVPPTPPDFDTLGEPQLRLAPRDESGRQRPGGA